MGSINKEIVATLTYINMVKLCVDTTGAILDKQHKEMCAISNYVNAVELRLDVKEAALDW